MTSITCWWGFEIWSSVTLDQDLYVMNFSVRSAINRQAICCILGPRGCVGPCKYIWKMRPRLSHPSFQQEFPRWVVLSVNSEKRISNRTTEVLGCVNTNQGASLCSLSLSHVEICARKTKTICMWRDRKNKRADCKRATIETKRENAASVGNVSIHRASTFHLVFFCMLVNERSTMFYL